MLFSGGVIFLVLFILSFTSLPYYAYHYLGTSYSRILKKTDLIIILGGNGMPGSDGLLRTFYGAKAALENSDAGIIIALPYGETDSLYQLNLMREELIIRGIDSARISFEPYGYNTRSQATNIAGLFNNELKNKSLLIVTSPEHTYRAVRTFHKAGFSHVAGLPTFECPVEPEKIKDKTKTKDIRVRSLGLRYNMWSYMHYELKVLREYCAICYYKLKGWI